MGEIRIAKPRPRWLSLGSRPRARQGPRAPFWILGASWAVLCAALAVLPAGWVRMTRERSFDAWFAQSRERAVRLTQEWEHWTVRVPGFRDGDEPEVREWLAREALLEALVDTDTGQVWIRDGDRLRPARDPEERRAPADLARRATQASPFFDVRSPSGSPKDRRYDSGPGWLPGFHDSRPLERCSIVAYFGKWCLLKRWVPGSPEVERWLQGTLGPGAGYRFGILNHRRGAGRLVERPLEAFLAGPAPTGPGALQFMHPDEAPFRVDRVLSNAFGDTWNAYLQMSPAAFRAFRREDLRRRLLAWTAYGITVGGSGLALAVVLFTRRRERRIADRLASLTHSLKTPLALLQLRCETALNPDLGSAERDARLLEIRNGADHMARTIEACLEEMRSTGERGASAFVGPEFFERLDEKVSPGFETRARVLEVYAPEAPFPCSPAALDSALSTLVENALMHGRGRVEVRARRQDHSMRISVTDEGDGIPEPILRTLARRGGTQPGPHREGAGLGLAVLADLAREEGWGLTFGRIQDGFEAVVEIPLP